MTKHYSLTIETITHGMAGVFTGTRRVPTMLWLCLWQLPIGHDRNWWNPSCGTVHTAAIIPNAVSHHVGFGAVVALWPWPLGCIHWSHECSKCNPNKSIFGVFEVRNLTCPLQAQHELLSYSQQWLYSKYPLSVTYHDISLGQGAGMRCRSCAFVQAGLVCYALGGFNYFLVRVPVNNQHDAHCHLNQYVM